MMNDLNYHHLGHIVEYLILKTAGQRIRIQLLANANFIVLFTHWF